MEAWMYVNIVSVILGIKFSQGTGEIRCYCNDATCVNKGYMCKSSVGRCFSILAPDGATVYRSMHGCAEHLSGRLATVCTRPEPDSVEYDANASGSVDHFRSRVVCCADNMCNYHNAGSGGGAQVQPLPVGSAPPEASPDEKLNTGRHDPMQAHKTSDKKAVNGVGVSEKRPAKGSHHPVPEDTARQDVWFRAAVISVPIAGLVILILLILLAVRLLRTDYVTKTSSSLVDKSPQPSVVYADELRATRTMLAPPIESSGITIQSTKYFKLGTDKVSQFPVDSAKLKTYRKFRPPSECSQTEWCDLCQIHANRGKTVKTSAGSRSVPTV